MTKKEEGVWRTIRGTRVFIKEGESPKEAIKRAKESAGKTEQAARKAADLPEKGKEKSFKEMTQQEQIDKLFDDILEEGPDYDGDDEQYEQDVDEFLSSGYLESKYGIKRISDIVYTTAFENALDFQREKKADDEN